MKHTKKPKRVTRAIDRMVQSPDDWFPSFAGGMVRCSVIRMANSGPCCFRVCVWGADDFGMEKDFTVPVGVDIQLEMQQWVEWIEKLNSISIKELRAMGFENA